MRMASRRNLNSIHRSRRKPASYLNLALILTSIGLRVWPLFNMAKYCMLETSTRKTASSKLESKRRFKRWKDVHSIQFSTGDRPLYREREGALVRDAWKELGITAETTFRRNKMPKLQLMRETTHLSFHLILNWTLKRIYQSLRDTSKFPGCLLLPNLRCITNSRILSPSLSQWTPRLRENTQLTRINTSGLKWAALKDSCNNRLRN